MPELDVRAAVLEFFAERGKPIPDAATDLFDSGIIDSMDLIELVAHLESAGGMDIPQEAMTVDNFRNLNAIVAIFNGGAKG